MNGNKLNGAHVTVFKRIKALLSRSFSLCTVDHGVSIKEALLVIRNDVEEMARIFKEHEALFLQPRVNLFAYKWDAEPPSELPLAPIKVEMPDPIIKMEPEPASIEHNQGAIPLNRS